MHLFELRYNIASYCCFSCDSDNGRGDEHKPNLEYFTLDEAKRGREREGELRKQMEGKGGRGRGRD